jgi:uncharacterized membrane-anchored protein
MLGALPPQRRQRPLKERVAANARRDRLGLFLAKGVEVGWMDVEMLVASGYLDPDDAENGWAIGAAINRLLAHTAELWIRDWR